MHPWGRYAGQALEKMGQRRPEEMLDWFANLESMLEVGNRLLLRFRRLIARRAIRDVDTSLNDAIASDLAPFVSLAHGIPADRAADDAGLNLPWSTGPVEGHVTRAKLLKRQGYGRAKTGSLRRRMVSAA